MRTRDPTSEEAKEYLLAVSNRDENMFLGLFTKYPNVLWASIHSNMPDEAKEWAMNAIKKIEGDDEDWIW